MLEWSLKRDVTLFEEACSRAMHVSSRWAWQGLDLRAHLDRDQALAVREAGRKKGRGEKEGGRERRRRRGQGDG
jgi:hypothetical protein